MKFIAAIVCALTCASSFAAGPYDGIYQYGSLPVFASVHQNGNTMLMATMGTTPISNVNFAMGPGFAVRPSSIDNWTYAIGSINGNATRITGVAVFGACTVTTDLSFDGAGFLTSNFVSVENTAFANQQGVNCVTLYQTIAATIGTTLVMRKIF